MLQAYKQSQNSFKKAPDSTQRNKKDVDRFHLTPPSSIRTEGILIAAATAVARARAASFTGLRMLEA